MCPGNQFEIKDAYDRVVAVLVGPSCLPCNCSKSCCKDVLFDVMSPDMNSQLGTVNRKYLGCWTHYLTTADSFLVNCKQSLPGFSTFL